MKYPRIYSISTVGILKHYNQDYLLHQIRTDFAGSNGVGKSIIADLLQLIFIPDSSVFRFGTEGIDNQSRQLSSLPYKTNHAYAFLNIEVRLGYFVTIGVYIPRSRNTPIKSFLVLESDLENSLDELAYPSSKWLNSNDFIKNKAILFVDDLAKHLRKSKNLYFLPYTTKSQKNDFYTFLYEKQILSINLSIDNNFKAFAKVIQSFSKAKSLNVSDSNSLKDFLLEDKGKEYLEAFDRNKTQFKQLLDEYNKIIKYIDELESKQENLKNLKSKENKKNTLYQEYLTKKLAFKDREKKLIELELNKSNNELIAKKERYKSLKQRNIKITKIISQLEKILEQRRKSREALEKYKVEYAKIKQIKNQIEEIANLELPKILENIDCSLDISDYDNSEIVRRANIIKPIYSKYGSLVLIEQKCLEQQKELDSYKLQLDSKIRNINKTIRVLNLSQKNTLLAKVIKKGQKLSIEQETVLFNLLDVCWEKPETIEQATRYTNSTEILDSYVMEDTKHNGIWINYGSIKEFLLLKDEQIFNDPKKLKQALSSKISELQKLLESDEQKLVQIENFQTGKNFEIPELDLDADLKDYSAFEQLRETASIIQNIDQKIASLQKQIDMCEQKLTALESHIKLPVDRSNIDKQIAKIQRSIDIGDKRLKNLEATKNKEIGEFEQLPDIVLQLKKSIDEKEGSFKDCEINHMEIEAKLISLFPGTEVNLETDQNIDENELEKLRSDSESAKTEYIAKYGLIVELFQETKERIDVEINGQIDNRLYNFPILEKVLLGDKIKHYDKISDALLEANRSKIRIGNLIQDEMFAIFSATRETYSEYRDIIRELNSFFRGRKISNKYFFRIDFEPHSIFNIDWITSLQMQRDRILQHGELALKDITVDTFIEDIFKQVSGYKKNIQAVELLNPKKYFNLSVRLTDDDNKNISGSTGQSYSAIVLLGIGRLSIVQKSKKVRKGIKFIILEETASLDKNNFNTFPKIAEEFGYQILTMTPEPYGGESDAKWYLHHLRFGHDDPNINSQPASYFRTNNYSEDLEIYLQNINYGLESS